MDRPTVILPGFFADAKEYRTLETTLCDRAIPTTTVPLRWFNWIPTIGGRSITPILQALDATIQQVRQTSGCDQINLIGHSAGGWIARIYLGDIPYNVHPKDADATAWNGRSGVHTLITLGTPHISQERWTRTNLDFVNHTYPGAFYPEVTYVCIAGKAVQGDRRRHWFAYSSYELTSGEGTAWGDGITPIAAAHLAGAKNLVFDNIYHSPRGDRTWYGSPSCLDQWIHYL